MFFTTNINEVVTYKFFTSMIPRKAFLGIPFIWFSLRSLNKEREKKIHCIKKRTYFSNLHEIMEHIHAWKSRCFWIRYTTRCFQFALSPLEVCGMSWNDSPTKTTRIHDTNDRTSRKHCSNVVMTMWPNANDLLSEYLQPNLMSSNCSPVVQL